MRMASFSAYISYKTFHCFSIHAGQDYSLALLLLEILSVLGNSVLVLLVSHLLNVFGLQGILSEFPQEVISYIQDNGLRKLGEFEVLVCFRNARSWEQTLSNP
jgi:hypothetical protein